MKNRQDSNIECASTGTRRHFLKNFVVGTAFSSVMGRAWLGTLVADCQPIQQGAGILRVNISGFQALKNENGSVRLAREIPYGSDPWQARYGRRNLAESRNGQLAGMGLKRLRAYGTARNTKEGQLADFLLNLRTLGRLVRQATTQAPS